MSSGSLQPKDSSLQSSYQLNNKFIQRKSFPYNAQQPEVIVVNLSTSGSRLGGAAIAAEWHSRYMASNFPVELWRMWDKNFISQLDNLLIRHYRCRSKFWLLDRILPRQLRALTLESQILKDIIRSKPKIIHIQNPVPGLFFRKVVRQAKKAGIKVVVSTHGFYEVMNPNYGLNWLQRFAWKTWVTKPVAQTLTSVDAFISGYPQEQALLRSLGVDFNAIHLAPNGLNPYFLESPTPQQLNSVVDKYKINTDKPILLFIGNHTKNKGISDVIKVAEHINQPVTVIVGGKLLSQDEPKQYQRSHPPAPHVDVIFTDYLTLEEQRSLYHLSTLLLFPSLADTLPLTIIEAMAIGLPVVAYDVGGVSFQLAEGAGVVIEAGDFPSYLRSVEMLLNEPSQIAEMRKRAKQRQRSLFSWDLAAETTIKVYEKLMS